MLPRVDIEFTSSDLEANSAPAASVLDKYSHSKPIQKIKPSAMLSYQRRLEIIYLRKVHQVPISTIADAYGKNESSIRKILKEFQVHGRINKLLTCSAKQLVLKKRLIR